METVIANPLQNLFSMIDTSMKYVESGYETYFKIKENAENLDKIKNEIESSQLKTTTVLNNATTQAETGNNISKAITYGIIVAGVLGALIIIKKAL